MSLTNYFFLFSLLQAGLNTKVLLMHVLKLLKQVKSINNHTFTWSYYYSVKLWYNLIFKIAADNFRSILIH